MTVYEFLKVEREFFQVMEENGVRSSDIRYISIYSRYLKFLRHGDSTEDIISFMAEEYQMKKEELSSIVETFSKEFIV